MSAPTIHAYDTRGTHVIEVNGDLDLDSAPKLARQASEAIAGGRLDLLLDLRDVEMLDSTGLAVLLNLKRRVTRRRGRLRLVCGPRVLRPLEVTRLDEDFQLFRTRRAALAADDRAA